MSILSAHNLSKIFHPSRGLLGPRRQPVYAVNDVSFAVERGECLGIVGESGSGKTTLSRMMLGLEAPTAGRIVFDGVDLSTLDHRRLRSLRSRIQVVFQDPYASLNPRMTVRDIIAEPLEVHRDVVRLSRRQTTDRVVELLELVRMDASHAKRLPHEFSGGQRQRIGIARALACNPELIVLDEPTSALDVSVQAQILALLIKLQQDLGLTYVFISHDLAVVRYICDRLLLLRHGRLVEQGDVEQVFTSPQTDYARTLIGSTPDIDPDRSPFNGPAAS